MPLYKGPILVLAPHQLFPARNGSDISLDRIAKKLSKHVVYVDLVGSDRQQRYENGEPTTTTPLDNAFRATKYAAVRTILRQSHFYLEKFLTPGFRNAAERMLQDDAYQVVLHSYVVTATLVTADIQNDARTHLIWSHNDEFKWFVNLREATKNPLGKYVSTLSERWLHRFFQQHQRNFTFLHVTEADQAGYAVHYPKHTSALIPIGVDQEEEAAPALPGPLAQIRLTFVGSLGVKMNLDALQHFAEAYYPTLQEHFGDNLEMRVVGSSPSVAVQALCRENGWALHPNVSDDKMRHLLNETTFTLLPFNYATGAKLKLLKSLAHGVPYLGTTYVHAQDHAGPYPCLLADEPQAWADRIAEVQKQGLSADVRKQLTAMAEQHSWDSSARKLLEAL